MASISYRNLSAAIWPSKSKLRSALLPSRLETLLLAIFPAILLLGTLFGILDPAARHSTYSVNLQSHLQHSAPSYFAKKDNIFNIFFVKRGWAWVTFSYFFFLFTHPSLGPYPPVYVGKRVHGIMRYCVVTLWWIFVTQWFFGPAIIDRGFKFTGGYCDSAVMTGLEPIDVGRKNIISTAATCKAAGGKWRGGHDISGHVFLLVLGTMFLLEEVLFVTLARHREDQTMTKKRGDTSAGEIYYEKGIFRGYPEEWTLGSRLAIGVAIMNLYMLMMTAAYFHTWLEKLTGLTMAFLGIFIVFFLPRILPALGCFLGLPKI